MVQTRTTDSGTDPAPRKQSSARVSILVLSGLLAAMTVALIASLVTRPSGQTLTTVTSAPSLTPQQATSQTCDGFTAALNAVVTAGRTHRPAQWSFTDPGVDNWINPFTTAVDQAVTGVQIAPGTNRTVTAAVGDWISAALMASQAMLTHDGRSLDTLDGRAAVAEVAARRACGRS
ncbi:hypothetical protein [Nocardia altamirensis]|uniref:hypothetical protein n=1 Tax=Nocardia altamirensis TaxID=472158 RepID=UPI00084085B1|nr:hypothetical protein [Nocardia altamirensis]